MSQNLAKYHSRSPRYVLDSDDDSLIRLAGPQRTPWEEGTQIRNVSLTGLAFTAPDDLYPQLGEVIKIQFTVPGGKQMACHALVTRLDPEGKDQKLVGVHFYKMELAQRVALAQGLGKKVNPESENFGLLNPNAATFQITAAEFPTIIFMASLLSLWCWLQIAFIRMDYQGLIHFFVDNFK